MRALVVASRRSLQERPPVRPIRADPVQPRYTTCRRRRRALDPRHRMAPLSTGEIYDELGADYSDKRRNNEAFQRRLVAQLEAMGHEVTLDLPPDQPSGLRPSRELGPRTPSAPPLGLTRVIHVSEVFGRRVGGLHRPPPERDRADGPTLATRGAARTVRARRVVDSSFRVPPAAAIACKHLHRPLPLLRSVGSRSIDTMPWAGREAGAHGAARWTTWS